ncbi:hypothetical protein [Pandoraea sp.]|uniref:hypothetical protein n=1 Tax=Pandoraea sp. TaxID=1883445 RepID=UPI00120F4179|nr:hypothetical protein [Pandoraea sp.]TAL52272.1 MAG: hypothetical protein EPN80_19010 [Pandoraea sp.]TAM16083.1 MAG: hypothetical protein EPN65_15255 [Pandoraea sp.]
MLSLTNAHLILMFALAALGGVLVGTRPCPLSLIKIGLRAIGIVAGAILAVLALELLPALL